MDKPVESITKCHFNRCGKQSSAGVKKSGAFRGQPNAKPVNSTNNMVQCSNCGMTHPKNQCPVYRVTCFKCNRIGHYATECRSSSSNSTQNTRQFTRFHGRGRTPHGRGFTPRRQVNKATEIPEAKSNKKSDLDIVRFMDAYGLSNNSPQTSLKQRVQVDDNKVIDIGLEHTVNSMTKEFTMPMPVLHGAPTEYDVCTEWCKIEQLKPISSYTGHQCIQMEANILIDWNIDALLQEPKTIHLIEIDSIACDSVYTHVTLNNEICCAKLDTGAQINVMTESLFKHIGKINKLPLYPKSDAKLVGYGNRNIEYIGTTVVGVTHLTQTKKATFYVTKLNSDKVILGLCLCIDLQLLSVHCDEKCWCKSQMLYETKKICSEFQIGVACNKHNKTFYHQFQLVPNLKVM